MEIAKYDISNQDVLDVISFFYKKEYKHWDEYQFKLNINNNIKNLFHEKTVQSIKNFKETRPYISLVSDNCGTPIKIRLINIALDEPILITDIEMACEYVHLIGDKYYFY